MSTLRRDLTQADVDAHLADAAQARREAAAATDARWKAHQLAIAEYCEAEAKRMQDELRRRAEQWRG